MSTDQHSRQMRTNYVLIDFENVQPEFIGLLQSNQFKVLVFVGVNQTKLSFSIAAALQELGNQAQYIKIAGSGPNALDFHIAFYLGKLATTEPRACLHVVSNDKGFDPLIQHLRSLGMIASRVCSIQEMPLNQVLSRKIMTERVEASVTKLKKLKTSKPRTLKTLSSTLASLFLKKLTDQEIQNIIQSLVKKGFVVCTNNKVSYELPTH